MPRLRANDSYSPFQEHLQGGLASGMRPEDFDAEQLALGVEVELEHVGSGDRERDREIATEIAMDHLVEDEAYYQKLKQMEMNPADVLEDVVAGQTLITPWGETVTVDSVNRHADGSFTVWYRTTTVQVRDQFGRAKAGVAGHTFKTKKDRKGWKMGYQENGDDDPFDLGYKSVPEILDERRRKAEEGDWYPASGGTEQPFRTRTGKRLQYLWQPSTGRHAYYDLDTDMILSDEEAMSPAYGLLGYERNGLREVVIYPVTSSVAKRLMQLGRVAVGYPLNNGRWSLQGIPGKEDVGPFVDGEKIRLIAKSKGGGKTYFAVDAEIVAGTPYHALFTPLEMRTTDLTENARAYYVFEMSGAKPLRQVNVKPLTLAKAKQLARIGAQNGKHDRAVTTDPRREDFRIVGGYEAGYARNEKEFAVGDWVKVRDRPDGLTWQVKAVLDRGGRRVYRVAPYDPVREDASTEIVLTLDGTPVNYAAWFRARAGRGQRVDFNDYTAAHGGHERFEWHRAMTISADGITPAPAPKMTGMAFRRNA